MKVRFLGTGTSIGVPEIGCKCEVCTSKDMKDRRLRASVFICINDKNILIDCGPDFRTQMMNEEFKKIDALLLTHEHYDHVGGIDDLRPFCKFGAIDIYANKITLEAMRKRIPYCFEQNLYPGVPVFNTHEISSDTTFSIEEIDILPINVMHYKLPILGYRIGNFAYLTDVKTLPIEEFDKLKNLDTLVISSLRPQRHISHQTLDEALVIIKRISPKRTYLTHMSHHMGLHEERQNKLPENIFLAYDGLEIKI